MTFVEQVPFPYLYGCATQNLVKSLKIKQYKKKLLSPLQHLKSSHSQP
jgi:hypothetical protein